MNQQLAYLNQLKQMMDLYQFMVKLCWLKTLLDAQVSEKRTSGFEKSDPEVCPEKSACKSLSHQEKPEISTITASEVIKGRMYDFNNGRFLSVDPFIQGSTSQAINPYSYIQNNPLSGTDPTGYETCKLSDSSSCFEEGENTVTDDDGNELGILTKGEDGSSEFTVTTVKGFQFANENGIELQGTNDDIAFKDGIAEIGSYLQQEYDARLDFAGNVNTVKQDNRSALQVFGDAYKELGPGGLAADCLSRECSGFEKAMASIDFVPGLGKIVAEAGMMLLPFIKRIDDLSSARTPTGARGDVLDVPDGINAPASIGGIDFSGHALDRMQRQGITPTAVQNAINPSNAVAGKAAGTVAYFDKVNNLTVITNSTTGRVITVDYGIIKQK